MLTAKAKARLEKNLAEIINHPVAVAVRPLRDSATDAAAEYARGVVEKVKADLAAANWDINVAAPYPKSTLGRNEYVRLKNRYHLFQRLTKSASDRGYRMHGEPDTRKMDKVEIEAFVTECQNEAGFNYDAFVIKLVKKIGEVAKAELTGNGVWQYSILTVTKADGTVENWKTQQIINTSSLGLMFNQWPTRKIK